MVYKENHIKSATYILALFTTMIHEYGSTAMYAFVRDLGFHTKCVYGNETKIWAFLYILRTSIFVQHAVSYLLYLWYRKHIHYFLGQGERLWPDSKLFSILMNGVQMLC